jgi:hypothetical protein
LKKEPITKKEIFNHWYARANIGIGDQLQLWQHDKIKNLAYKAFLKGMVIGRFWFKRPY